MGDVLKSEYLAWRLFFAILIAGILISPFFLMRFERGFYQSQFPQYFSSWRENGSFSPIETSSDSRYYAARIHQMATHWVPADPWTGESSAKFVMTDFISFESIALIFRVLKSVLWAWVFSQAIFSILWFFLLVRLLDGLGGSEGQCIWIATTVTLFAHTILVDFNLRLFQHLLSPLQHAFWFLGSYHWYFGPTRIVRPLITYPSLFLAGILLTRAEEKGRGYFFAGIAGGLLAYIHEDVWLAFGGSVFLYCLWKSLNIRQVYWRGWFVLAVFSLVSLPWIFICRPSPEQLGDFGKIIGRHFSWESLPFLLGSVVTWASFPKRPMRLWFSSVLISIFFALNAQLILGYTFSPDYWQRLGNVFLVLVFGLLIARTFHIEDKSYLWLAALSCAFALPRVIGYSAFHYQLAAIPRPDEEAFEWLNSHTPKDSLVATLNPLTNLRLPIYTHNQTGIAYSVSFYPGPSHVDNVCRLLTALSFYGVLPSVYVEDFIHRPTWNEKMQWTKIPNNERLVRGRGFLSMSMSASLSQLLRAEKTCLVPSFQPNYLWVANVEKNLLNPGALTYRRDLKKVFDNQKIAIYSVLSKH